MAIRPPPLVPPEVDLRDFAYMPLEVARLRQSSTLRKTNGDEFRCALLLWCAAWHQVPAASLPNDDQDLADYAGFGFAVDAWQRVKVGAMRGWILCADNRWYHPVVAEKALNSWHEKLLHKWRKECDRVRKLNEARRKISMPPLEIPPRPTEIHMLSVGKSPDFRRNDDGFPSEGFGDLDSDEVENQSEHSNPQDGADCDKLGENAGKSLNTKRRSTKTRTSGEQFPSENADFPTDQAPLSDGNGGRSHGIPTEKALKGREGNIREEDLTPQHGALRSGGVGSELKNRITDQFRIAGSMQTPDTHRVDLWMAKGYDPDVCLAVIAELLANKPEISALKYFDRAIAEAHQLPHARDRQTDIAVPRSNNGLVNLLAKSLKERNDARSANGHKFEPGNGTIEGSALGRTAGNNADDMGAPSESLPVRTPAKPARSTKTGP